MSVDIISFLLIAACLVVIGFASGPAVARRFGAFSRPTHPLPSPERNRHERMRDGSPLRPLDERPMNELVKFASSS